MRVEAAVGEPGIGHHLGDGDAIQALFAEQPRAAVSIAWWLASACAFDTLGMGSS